MIAEHRLRFSLMLMSLFGVLILACAPTQQEPLMRWQGDQATIVLEYRGQARAVFAAGDWNDWVPLASPFQWRGGERWLLELELPPGEHAYLLAVETDDKWEWKLDPANPVRTQDAGGRELSLLTIGTVAGVDD